MENKVRIALIGCTGSIGRQVLDVVRRYPEQFTVTALACGSDAAALARLDGEFHPKISVCAADGHTMSEELYADCDVAFVAASGFAGLKYTLGAIRAGKRVALANKESLVCGGELVTAAARERGVEIVPVDSEHSAIFQALGMRREAPFARLILTCSGGPFLHCSEEELKGVTATDALSHPTWRMGPKITVDSATLLNKGYEVIEAKWLYGADFDQIEAVVHPESIVHSLVAFADGAVLAQLGYPDMRVPIQLALTYPARLPCAPALDLAEVGALHFERMPAERFPCFRLALQAGRRGGTAPTLLNAAAEVAVGAFLRDGIGFLQIADIIEEVLARIPCGAGRTYGELAEADLRAREAARKIVYGS